MMAERHFTRGEREAEAKAGDAMPGGAYPMPDCDAVARAIEAYGREVPERRAALRAMIVRRKVELGCDDVEIPDTWRLDSLGN